MNEKRGSVCWAWVPAVILVFLTIMALLAIVAIGGCAQCNVVIRPEFPAAPQLEDQTPDLILEAYRPINL